MPSAKKLKTSESASTSSSAKSPAAKNTTTLKIVDDDDDDDQADAMKVESDSPSIKSQNSDVFDGATLPMNPDSSSKPKPEAKAAPEVDPDATLPMISRQNTIPLHTTRDEEEEEEPKKKKKSGSKLMFADSDEEEEDSPVAIPPPVKKEAKKKLAPIEEEGEDDGDPSRREAGVDYDSNGEPKKAAVAAKPASPKKEFAPAQIEATLVIAGPEPTLVMTDDAMPIEATLVMAGPEPTLVMTDEYEGEGGIAPTQIV